MTTAAPNLSKVRHDLRTPLNHILGYGEMLVEDATAAGQSGFAKDCGRILESGRRMLELISEHLGDDAPQPPTPASVAILLPLFRTPAVSVIGYCDLLADPEPAANRAGWQQDLARIREAACRWLELAEAHFRPRWTPPRHPRVLKPVWRAVLEAGADNVSPTSPTFIRGRLLVVDDDDSNRDVLARQLVKLGHETQAVTGGAEALALLARKPFDLVLLDLIMPGMSGDAVLSTLKNDPANRHLPVLMVSAADELEGVVRCLALGAEDYLPKPCDPRLLQVRVQSALEKKRLRDQEQRLFAELRAAHGKSSALLRNIMPLAIAERLQNGESPLVDSLAEVTVLFADLAGFTRLFDHFTAREIVTMLDGIFSCFDELARRRGLEKIKTIGDAYMVVGGQSDGRPDHAATVADLALAMQASLQSLARRFSLPVGLRIGMDSGPALAGVIGRDKLSYDLWGDTVNTASRMETLGEAGRIHITDRLRRQLHGRFHFQARRDLEVKGKGRMTTWWLTGRKPAVKRKLKGG